MANGPPTPPPTTEVEIQDEARGISDVNTVTTDQAPTAVAPLQDAYQAVFPKIAELASQHKFRELIRVAENTDINSDTDSDRRLTRLLVAAPLVLSYLIMDDLAPARFSLTRLPETVSSSPVGVALVQLLASTWERNHASVYSRAESLYNLVRQPNFFDERLASVLPGLVTRFVDSFRQRTVALLAKVYTSVPVPLAQTYLGMKHDELLVAAYNAQWSYNPSANTLNPTISSSGPSNTLEPAYSSLSTFHFVANSVAKLELS